MKQYPGVLKRVEEIEYKCGIKYAKVDGKLYKTLNVFYVISFIWTLLMNSLYLAGVIMINSGRDTMKDVLEPIITVTVCTVALIFGLVFKKLKLNIASLVTTLVSAVILNVLFGRLLQDFLGFAGFKISFYWRHLGPLVLLSVMIIWMTVIALREKYKKNKLYSKVENDIYNSFHNSASEMTEEQWNEFMENYDHDEYRKLLKKK